jgi:hypothetical protein
MSNKTFTLSAVALALPADGRIVACDVSEKPATEPITSGRSL